MKLFEIDDQIEAILSQRIVDTETGEVIEDITEEQEQALNDLEEALEVKVLACAAYLKGELAEGEAVEKVAKGLLARAKAHKNRGEWLRGYIESHVSPGEKFRDARSEVTWRKASHVEVGCAVAELPEEFRRIKIEISANKKAIGDAIKAGKKVLNCWVEKTTKLVVR